MFNEERQIYIIDKINRNGRVKVSDLAEELNVSEVTIRKDLQTLEKRDFLKRNFGGAISIKEHVKPLTLEEKKIENINLKKIIANKAENLLRDNMDIFLDAGTTTYALIEKIVKYKNMNVITFDMNSAIKLAKYHHVHTYLVGGSIEAKTLCLLSIDGYKLIENMHADICFAGTDAFDNEYAYSTNNLKAQIKAKMLDNSKIKVLLSDSSKYPKDGLFSFYKLKDFDYVISDKQNKELNSLIESWGC